ncbi:UNVERIFIED_CONTAM: major ampullate spidroin protein MaSp-b [Trichonephila clavipes]
MTWTARLALSILAVLCTQGLFAQGQNTPWSSTELADAFINAFLNEAGRTGAFTADQLDDMSTIGDTLKTAMDKMARSNKSSQSKLQALNMAFASSMAEIAAVEQGGLSVAEKTNAIADSLNSAFYQTTGAVNVQFVNEIRSLISMFAQASANEVSYGGGYGGGQGGQSAGAAAAAASAGAGQGGYGGLGGQGAGASAAAAAAGGAGEGGLGDQGAGRGAGAAAAAAGGVRQGGYGGLGGQGAGRGGQGAGAAAAAAGGAGQGGYGGLGGQGVGRGGLGGQGAGAAAAVGAGQGGYGGVGSGASAASAAASRLSSPQASSRVSSAVSNLVASGPTNSAALSSTISNVVSQIGASNPGLSGCDVLIQALLEVVSALIQILGSSSIGQVNYGSAGQATQIVGQSVYQALG